MHAAPRSNEIAPTLPALDWADDMALSMIAMATTLRVDHARTEIARKLRYLSAHGWADFHDKDSSALSGLREPVLPVRPPFRFEWLMVAALAVNFLILIALAVIAWRLFHG